MRTYTITEYNYDDMIALEGMSAEEVSNTLEQMYRGWFNKYVFPREGEIYSEVDFDNYKIQCAFNIVYKLLRESKEREEGVE